MFRLGKCLACGTKTAALIHPIVAVVARGRMGRRLDCSCLSEIY